MTVTDVVLLLGGSFYLGTALREFYEAYKDKNNEDIATLIEKDVEGL